MSEPIIIIQTTLPKSWEEFEVGSFSQILLEAGASCVQHSTIKSMYRWDGEIASSSEWVLEIKVDSSNKESVISKIEEVHPYEIPQILFWNALASDSYATWVQTDSSSFSKK